MLFEHQHDEPLKAWLVRTVTPICDAEPKTLAAYILALLKPEATESELRPELYEKLEEFLEQDTNPFLDTLFTALRTKSYLPYTVSAASVPGSADNGIPIPLDELISTPIPTAPRGRKRSLEQDESFGRGPAKGPRLAGEGPYPNYGNGGRGNVNGRGAYNGMTGHGDGMGRGRGMGYGPMNGGMGRGPRSYIPPDQMKRGICRDYHNNGYCGRGAYCKYSHGDDVVVPGMYPMNGASLPAGQGVPYVPMHPNSGAYMSGPGGAYDPAEAHMDMRSQNMGQRHQRPPLMSRVREDGSQIMNGIRAPGELPVIQDLTPPSSQEQPVTQSSNEPSLRQAPQHTNGLGGPGPGGVMGGHGPPHSQPMDVDVAHPMSSHPAEPRAPIAMRNAPRGGVGGGGSMGGGGGMGRGMNGAGARGRGRGQFGGEAHNFSSSTERRQDKTLVVEKIPEDHLSLESVNGWFKRFGTVTNVAIDARGAKALVSFEDHGAAHAAWKSEDAVFGNRFVKVFWHRPMEGHGQVGARMLAASAPAVKNMTTPTTSPVSAPVAAPIPAAPPAPQKTSTPSSAAATLAAKQKLLEEQIAEQKSLMEKLGTVSGDEKKQVMARLRKLGEEMKPVASSKSSTPAKSPAPAAGNKEQKERERLDKELELHSAVKSSDSSSGETTEALQAKLARLRAEAASLGMPEASTEPSYGGYSASYRGFRGRGRGARSYYRGAARGGPPRASMKLDNRPKKLLVKGARAESMQGLRDWFETTGQLDTCETVADSAVIVSFKTRAAAEQGLAKGSNIPTVGQVEVSWFTGQSAPAAAKAASPSVAPTEHGEDAKDEAPSHAIEDLHHGDEDNYEEMATSGWGGDDDHGMGML